MKKRISALCLALAATFAFGACGDSEPSGGSSTSDKPVDGIKLSYEFDELDQAYMPRLDKVKQMEGSIDVAIVFDGTEAGWRAVADEYEKIHGGAVGVVLDTKYNAASYKEIADTEVADDETEWDIVQGNLLSAKVLTAECYNMYSSVYGLNAYAGNKYWTEVLTKNAYVTDTSGMNTDVFIMNSLNLNTGWFVNKEALAKAAAEGYNGGVAKNPETWAELISLCDYMQKAGYSEPLGLSLHPSSVGGSQFMWLLRIYGDYYYRNMYDYVQKTRTDGVTYKVDLTAETPEAHKDFDLSHNKLLSTILDPETPLTIKTSAGQTESAYVGANSARFKEFLSQFEALKPYLAVGADTVTHDEMRSEFYQQSQGDDSPQIFLDFVGSGLLFGRADSKVDADLFDYPTMHSKGGFIKEGTIVRDVGGNGGYLSIVSHDASQNRLNLDFIKFFMSPYGQSIYYNALEGTSATPQGLTTVNNDLVAVPEKWKAFFSSEKVQFSGLSDNNEYIEWLICGLCADATAMQQNQTYWKRFMMGEGDLAMTATQFATNWHSTLLSAWPREAKNLRNWSVNCWKPENLDLDDGIAKS